MMNVFFVMDMENFVFGFVKVRIFVWMSVRICFNCIVGGFVDSIE